MREGFEHAAASLSGMLQPGEAFTAYFEGEDSDFVRLNGNRIRQAGSVRQERVTLNLIRGERHVQATLPLTGETDDDAARLRSATAQLRALLPHVPLDPYLAYAGPESRSDDIRGGHLPDRSELVQALTGAADGLDLVGHCAKGRLCRGFAGSEGQWHWFETESFSLDWSLYHRADKAVKGRYAGRDWDPEALTTMVRKARDQLTIMACEPVRLDPGRYRVFLAPAALMEILSVIAWQSFGLRAHRTRQTPLLRLVDGDAALHPEVNLDEHSAGGQAPRFGPEGFLQPGRVALIANGRHSGCLADARSGREYGVTVNAAAERPESLEMAPGTLAAEGAARAVGNGLLISDLWYANLSDRASCSVTGMTRYACLKVADGVPVAPVEPMRFDVSLYQLLGQDLLGLTRERERIVDTGTYGQRSTASALLPGALVRDFPLTL
jgi:predicted Zn-dependent protease